MSTRSIEAFQEQRRYAKTLPPPPDAADHILQRVAKRRALIAQMTQEADELERVAHAMKERTREQDRQAEARQSNQ